MIDPKDAVLLLIDHQSGLFRLVRNIDQPRHHHLSPRWPNGPFIPEIHQEPVPTSASPLPPWASCAEVPACFEKNSVQSLVGPRTRPISQNAKKGRRAR